MPPSLFKYEPPSSLATANFKINSIFFNSASKFNDPFDCCMTAFVADDLLEKLFKKKGNITSQDERGGEWLRRQKRSVCCFCDSSINILLWSHYSQHHTGFCLEFDATALPFSGAKPVDYTGKIPSVKEIKEYPTDQLVEYLFLIKAKVWRYEGEWRIFSNAEPKLHPYPPEALLAVHFGARIDPAVRDEICRIGVSRNPKIKFVQMSLNKKQILLDSQPYIFPSL